MALFEILKPKEANTTWANDGTIMPGVSKPKVMFCKSPKKLKELAELVKANDDVHYISRGDWSMHDLVQMMLTISGKCDLWLSTYSITEFPMRQIANWQHEGLVKQLYMLVDYKAKVRYPTVYQLAANLSNKIRLLPCHAKATVLVGEKLSLAMITSSNWTTNKRAEYGFISKQQTIIDFNLEWLKKGIDDGNIFG